MEWLAVAAVVVAILAVVAASAGPRIAASFANAACRVMPVEVACTAAASSPADTAEPSPSATPQPGGADAPFVRPQRPDQPGPDRDIQDDASDDRRRDDEAPTGNAEVDQLYAHFDAFEAYLWDAFGREGYDGSGGRLRGEVNYADSNNNAHFRPGSWPGWLLGHDRTTYGTGMASEFIVAHELGHALVESEVGLEREGDRHALNESLADMFASNVTGEWSVGDGTPLGAFRDMSDPTIHGHPDHVRDFEVPTEDSSKAHINAGITNRAYYLLVDGVGRGDAEQILYRSVTEHLRSDSGFEDFRSAMLTSASQLHGRDSDQYRAVDDAFAQVGLDGTWEEPT